MRQPVARVVLLLLCGILVSAWNTTFFDVDGDEYTGAEIVMVPCEKSLPVTFTTESNEQFGLQFADKKCFSIMRDGTDHFPINADPGCEGNANGCFHGCKESDSKYTKTAAAADGTFLIKSLIVKKLATGKRGDQEILADCLQASIPVDTLEEGTPVSFFACREKAPGVPVDNQKWTYDRTTGRLSTSFKGVKMCVGTGHRYKDFQQGCTGANSIGKPWCDTTKTFEERAKLLVDEMGQITGGNIQTATDEGLRDMIDQLSHSGPNLERMSLPAYNWWSESLHGVQAHRDTRDRIPTNFPAVVGLGATFDRKLFHSVAAAIGDEARALHHVGSNALLSSQFSLNTFSPNINIVRDPRWGRAQEVPSEDPYLTGVYAEEYVKGTQGFGSKYLKLVAVPKHFAVYSLDATPPVGEGQMYTGGKQRWEFNVQVTKQDIAQTYLPAFKRAVVNGQAAGIMCSYNGINGVPACVNSWLLNDTLRNEWGFNGFVTGDCNAVQQVFKGHSYKGMSSLQVAAEALKAGTDLDCHVGDMSYRHYLFDAVKAGLANKEDVYRAVYRLILLRMKLGMFDPLEQVEWARIPPTVVGSAENRALALRAARESIVLLKNELVSRNGVTKPLLPLGVWINNKEKVKIALIGPHVYSTGAFASVYAGEWPHIVSVDEAFRENSHVEVTTVQVLETVKSTDLRDMDSARTAARQADFVVVVIGSNKTVEREAVDRKVITMPGAQMTMLQQLVNDPQIASKVVVVLINGASIDISELKNTDAVKAVIEAWYPGEEGGHAIADVIYGAYNPSGRLPLSVYKAEFVAGDEQNNWAFWENHEMRAGGGRTYRFHIGDKILYEFGYGKSYSSFEYKILSAPAHLLNAQTADVTVQVTNKGPYAGDQSVLLFLVPQHSADTKPEDRTALCPLKQLVGFEHVSLAVGESGTVTFPISLSDALCFDKDGNQVAGAASFKVAVEDQLSEEMSATWAASTEVLDLPLSSAGIFGVFVAITAASVVILFLFRCMCRFAVAKQYRTAEMHAAETHA